VCTSGNISNLIGWHPNFAGNRLPGNGQASTFAHGKRVSVSVGFFLFVFESPMALASYGRRTATGSPSVIVNSMQILFGRPGAQTPPRLVISLKVWLMGAR